MGLPCLLGIFIIWWGVEGGWRGVVRETEPSKCSTKSNHPSSLSAAKQFKPSQTVCVFTQVERVSPDFA